MKNQVCIYVIMLSVFFSQYLLASDFETADKYLASYSHFDLEKMHKYYSEEATFQDLTSENFGENSFIMKGRENIIEAFKAPFFQKNFKLHYKIINKYESSGHHVFISDVTARTTNTKGTNYSCGNVVSIIKIVDKKVISHVDYADYNGFEQSSKNDKTMCYKF